MRNSDSKRILILGWAKLSQEEKQGGGYNLVASSLARGLVTKGHKVFYMRAGPKELISKPFWAPKIYEDESWFNIDCYSITNTPYRMIEGKGVWAPSFPSLRWLMYLRIANFIRKNEIEVVHVHAIEGFGFPLLKRLKQQGLRVVVTLHDMFTICEQPHLFFRNNPCLDYCGGLKCFNCRPQESAFNFLWYKIFKSNSLAEKIRSLFRPTYSLPNACGNASPLMNSRSQETSNLILQANLGKPHTGKHNKYSKLRLTNVAYLSHADSILASTNFLKSTLSIYDCLKSKVHLVRFGLPILDAIDNELAHNPISKNRFGKVHFGFIGSTYPAKGMEFLIDAYNSLPQDLQDKSELHIVSSSNLSAITGTQKHKNNIYFWDQAMISKYDFIRKNIDVMVFPHLCFEACSILMLEIMRLKKPAIVSDAGGTVEFLNTHPNSKSFRAGDKTELIKCITEAIDNQNLSLFANSFVVAQSTEDFLIANCEHYYPFANQILSHQ